MPHQDEDMEIDPHAAAEPPHSALEPLPPGADTGVLFPADGSGLVAAAPGQHLAEGRHLDLVVAGAQAVVDFRRAVGADGGPSLLELALALGEQIVDVLVVVRMVLGREVVGGDGVGDDLLVVETRATEGRGGWGRVADADGGVQGGALSEGVDGAWGLATAGKHGGRLEGGVGDVVEDLASLGGGESQ